MSEVRVDQTHSLDVNEAKARLNQFEELISKYGVKAVWKGNQAELKGTGVSGTIAVSPSTVSVMVKLGLIARAAGVDAKKLEGSISKRLKEAFES